MVTRTSRSLRRIALGSALSTLLCAAAAVAAAPVAAAGPAAAAAGCTAVDGVSVCTDFAKVGSPPAVIGQVAVDNQNTTLQGVLVVLEECWGSTCSVVSVATGEGWAVHAGPVTSVPGATYRTTASWVDNAGRQHHGVSTP